MLGVEYLLLTLKTDRPVSLGASPLSLYVSSLYQKKMAQNERPLSGGGYPLIQYKVIRGSPLIVAINEGCELLWEIYDIIDELNGKNPYQILEKRIIERKALLGLAEKRLKYRFLTPWLTITAAELNKAKNDPQQKARMLAAIIESNVMALARNFGITDDSTLSISINAKEENIIQKDTNIVGLFGTFFINFELPQFLGIGKGVSRGFGTIKQS